MNPQGFAASLRRYYLGSLDRMDRPGWRKFALAMVALAVGFLLAIYSGVFAQQGRVIATGICASLALLLAGYVALTAVPYLARRTSLEWLHVSMDYEITREGWIFMILILVIAVAGLNTGNNLLYLVLACLLAAILMSGILSYLVLVKVEFEALLPDHVFARRPAPARLSLINRKKFFPSFSIVLSGISEAGQTQVPKQSRKQKKRTRRSAATPPAAPELRDRRILRSPLYFPILPVGQPVTRTVELEFPHRGLYREKGFQLSTRFPFGFLEKSFQIPVSRDLWVYPAVEPTDEFYEILPMLSGEMEAFQRGRGHDLYSIRDLLSSDSARHIDWKASARTGMLKVREFTREDERRLQLILDRRIGPPPATPAPSGEALPLNPLEQFEAAVEFCACLAWHFYEVDAQLQFVCDQFRTPAARAGDIIYDILRFLAAVEPSRDAPLASPAEASAEENVFRIICTAAPRGSVPTALWNRAYLIFFDALRKGSGEQATRTAPDLPLGPTSPGSQPSA